MAAARVGWRTGQRSGKPAGSRGASHPSRLWGTNERDHQNLTVQSGLNFRPLHCSDRQTRPTKLHGQTNFTGAAWRSQTFASRNPGGAGHRRERDRGIRWPAPIQTESSRPNMLAPDAHASSPPARFSRWRIAGIAFVFLWFFIGGIAHFALTEVEMRIVPPWFPWPRAAVLISGVFELLGAAGLLWRPTRRAAGWGLFALTLAVTPAHTTCSRRPSCLACRTGRWCCACPSRWRCWC